MDLICCQETKQYSEKYDCFYCATCDKWLEEKCGDEECEYCWGRPPKPSDCQSIQDMGTESLDGKS